MRLFLKKEFYKNYLIYLIPLASCYLFFWKIGSSSFWFDELVTFKTVFNTEPTQFFTIYYTNQLHPPLYFFLLKFFLRNRYNTNCKSNCLITAG